MEYTEIVLAGLCFLSAAFHALHTPVVVCRVPRGGRVARQAMPSQEQATPLPSRPRPHLIMPSPSRTVSPFLTNRVPPSHSSPQTPFLTELRHLERSGPFRFTFPGSSSGSPFWFCLTFPLQGSVPADSRSGASLHLKYRSFSLDLAPSVLVLPFTDKAPSLPAQNTSPQRGNLKPFRPAASLHSGPRPSVVQPHPLWCRPHPSRPRSSLPFQRSPKVSRWGLPLQFGSTGLTQKILVAVTRLVLVREARVEGRR